jgi:predicted kinase
MLIIFGGLPGTGKTTIAKTLARTLRAVYLRIDSLEQALIRSGISKISVGSGGYEAAYAIASDNLNLGLTVVADSVNSLNITRNAWKNVALEINVQFIEIELICSNKEAHRSRIEFRIADISGHTLPDWESVLDREYQSWDSQHLIVDTSIFSVDQIVEKIIEHMAHQSNTDKK